MSNDNMCPFCDTAQSYRYILDGQYMRVIYPKNPGCAYHVLIVPKRHIVQFDKLAPEEVVELHEFVKRLHVAAKKHLSEDYLGYNILANNGGVAVNQHVMHSHTHIFLRTKQDVYDPIKEHRPDPASDLSAADKKHLQRLQQWCA